MGIVAAAGCHVSEQQATPTSYAVSGSVTGLQGVLQLQNANTTLAITQDGPFAFGGLADGTAYAVRVAAQPVEQACSLANPNGTVQGANVTNLAVTCTHLPMGPFSISGTVTGQSGTLVLQNNGESVTVAPTTHGFKFPTALAPGAAFNVTVLTPPTGQLCTVTHGSGSVDHANIANVAVVCAAGAYSISVTLSGASGPVSVQNEHQEVLQFASNGSAAFATAYAFNAPFSVQVTAQPNDQACTLQPQSGQVRANIPMQARCVSLVPLSVSVSGLQGQLVLQAGGDSLTFTGPGGNQNQTFASLRAPGSAYAVAIVQQPNGQACSVPAAGTVQAGGSRVQITCANLHTLSVTTLYAASAWTLGNNLGDSIVLPAGNANATFATPYAAGTLYRLNIQQQPNGQRCVTSASQGMVPDANLVVPYTCKSAYALGAGVNHLSGGSLVLKNDLGDALTFTQDGAQVFNTSYAAGDNFRVTVLQQPANQLCFLDSASGVINSPNTQVAIHCAWAATQFLGQPNASTQSPGAAPTGQSVFSPVGNAVWTGSQLFLPDTGANRVLGFAGMPSGNAPSASILMGQVNFNGAGSSAGSQGLQGPAGLAGDDNFLVVADRDNNRLLRYNGAPSGLHVAADGVLGQVDFASTASACGQGNVSNPVAVTLQGNLLLAAEVGGNRVLGWQLPGAQAASLVLGQPDFSTCTSQSTANSSGTTAPNGVWSNGSRLLVADTGHHRVLFWNTFPTTPGQAADGALGQANLQSSSAAADANGLDTPAAVTSDGTQVWVADAGNHRVLRWDTWPTASGAPADFVYGQRGFAAGSCNNGNSTAPDATTLCNPRGVAQVPGGLLVTDSGNHRFVLYP